MTGSSASPLGKDFMSSLPPAAREFEFTVGDFERVRKLIYQQAGISLSVAKQDMVYSRLARRLRATGLKNFSTYLDRLDRGDKVEWEHFINALTTNLTSFFREPHHFPILAEHLRKRLGSHPIRIWCCASSTGEEPYSLAMTIAESAGSSSGQVSIIASDVDTSVLSIAAKGEYGGDRIERLSPERVRRFFERRAGPDGESYLVRPEIRQLVSFQRINLLDPAWALRGPLDAIFCRNVMIYFDKPTQYKILSRFVPLMQSDGLLFAGHSESFLHAADLWRPLGKTVYAIAMPSRRA